MKQLGYRGGWKAVRGAEPPVNKKKITVPSPFEFSAVRLRRRIGFAVSIRVFLFVQLLSQNWWKLSTSCLLVRPSVELIPPFVRYGRVDPCDRVRSTKDQHTVFAQKWCCCLRPFIVPSLSYPAVLPSLNTPTLFQPDPAARSPWASLTYTQTGNDITQG